MNMVIVMVIAYYNRICSNMSCTNKSCKIVPDLDRGVATLIDGVAAHVATPV